MNNPPNPQKRFFGSFFTVLGTVLLLFAVVAFLNDGRPTLGWEITKWESLVPFLVGLVFLVTGVNIMNKN